MPACFDSMRRRPAPRPRPACTGDTTARCLWVTVALVLLALLQGCASVSVSSISPARYLAERRGDALTSGRLSTAAQEVLRVVGIDGCRDDTLACRERLRLADGITEEQRLSALSELWLEAALAIDKSAPGQPLVPDDATLTAWLETARHAYAYLFHTARSPGQRAFEDRQTQVRDYYNYAVQQTVTRLFHRYRSGPVPENPGTPVEVVGWRVGSRADTLRLPRNAALPDELIAASSLRFSGLRNTYRRDGFGAELIAVMPAPTADQADAQPFDESRFPVITALLRFEGATLAEVLATREVQVLLFDPHRSDQVELAGVSLPLAANFTAGYGLWLARSGFAVQSLRTLFGMTDGIVRPRVQLMQPYDPNRRTIVMLHGLASSPEAWVNVANEVLGDALLRQTYQIWQVYYPTNAPLPLNQRAIREALQQTIAHFDPQGTAQASQDMVLVGHSMGGVLARLLVSSAGDRLWQALPPSLLERDAEGQHQRLDPYLAFEPLPQVTRAIFIAAPHRGTPFADNDFSRRIANLVTLPLTMLEQLADMRGLFVRPPQDGDAVAASGPQRIPNSIDNLSDGDPFVRAAAALPISPAVRYHSILGQVDPALALAASSDGVVPYASAHLPGALTERVLPSQHSVQEHPLAIVEIRRILREQLDAGGAPATGR
jgi:pimeloyl-ACP methyl ester carboxylesterase